MGCHIGVDDHEDIAAVIAHVDMLFERLHAGIAFLGDRKQFCGVASAEAECRRATVDVVVALCGDHHLIAIAGGDDGRPAPCVMLLAGIFERRFPRCTVVVEVERDALATGIEADGFVDEQLSGGRIGGKVGSVVIVGARYQEERGEAKGDDVINLNRFYGEC